MYNQFINQMQSNLGAYMESNIQGSSQKKINRPSDDPAGMALALNYRNAISDTEQLERNVDTALGWLNLGDKTLTQVSTAISGIKALAEQAATSTMSAENRQQIATQLREYFGQLLNLSNTEFEGKSIFAGHKYTVNAFEQSLAPTCLDTDFYNDDLSFKIEGSSKSTAMLRFPDDAAVANPPAGGIKFQYYKNGEWIDGTTTVSSDGKYEVAEMDGVTFKFASKTGTTSIKGFDPDEEAGSHNGTMVYLRPSAVYQGDDNDPPPSVEMAGPSSGNVTNTNPQGVFGGKTLIRITETDQDKNPVPSPPTGVVKYTYSTDNGASWVEATSSVPIDPAGPPYTDPNNPLRLLVPGGYLDVKLATGDPGTDLQAGQQFVVRPHEADLGYEIMKDTYISVNSVGKDIFGGWYKEADGVERAQLGGGANNLFEVVGKLIGWCETNNQEGIQQCLADITEAQKVVLNEAARIGGLENRLGLAKDVLSFQKLDQEERLSYTEDVDLTELLTRMAQQELAYNTVLKSSSMIMQLNLTKFV